MGNGATEILTTLDRHLKADGTIRLMGGAALILGYGMRRSTEDADLLLDDREGQWLIDHAGFDEAVEKTNAELEPKGLYITHLWGPEQQILSPQWRERCRTINPFPLVHLKIEVLGPLDLILSKMCRADDGDLADIRYLIEQERISRPSLVEALDHAVVPEPFSDVYPVNRQRLEAMLNRSAGMPGS